MKVGYRIVWILVSIILLAALPVGAQSEAIRLDRVQVDIWPDYDRAAVLILLTGELPADTPLPGNIQFRIPAAAGEPNAVARVTPGGEMLNTPYQTRSSGDATLLTVETTELIVRVEYYLPYERDGDSVQFTYRWLGGVGVDELTILFQEPSQATAITTDSGFEEIGIQNDGRHYRQWLAGAVGEEETLAATFSYLGPLPASPITAPLPADPPPQNESPIVSILIAAAGGILIGAGFGWFLTRRRTPAQRSPRRRGRVASAGYCRQCGDGLQSDDVYCRQCGAKVR